jgi:queuine tRNA-ribosyltransferase
VFRNELRTTLANPLCFACNLESRANQCARPTKLLQAATMAASPQFHFELLHVDRHSGARLSRLTTPHGQIDLPTFMPVGTNGTVKGLTPQMILETGADIILGNTYHLALRPGEAIVRQMGGLHQFMGWPKPILTDSGGFQIFSLAQITKISETAAQFKSHIDGRIIELTPERSVGIQEALGSDIAMVLDHVVSLPATATQVQEACERTVRWAQRCKAAAASAAQVQFGIVQGGLDFGLRRWCCERLRALDFFGYAIGGLSVGEQPHEMYEALEATCPHLPADRPRYLMGVGRPQDLLIGISKGVDMFDCVMPTRNGRNGLAFTDDGPVRIRNQVHQSDPRPLMEHLRSPYMNFSRAYLRHLFVADEMLGPMLLSFHNLRYYNQLMRDAREAIGNDCFLDFLREKCRGWGVAFPQESSATQELA